MSSLPQPPHGPGKRPCTKFRHDTWEAAARERDRLAAKDLARGKPARHQVYHCQQCQAFHVGRVVVAKRGG